jgi:outer membrane protein insertion porin family
MPVRIIRNWFLLAIVVCSILPTVASAAKIDSVIVRGNRRYNVRTVRATSGILVGDDLASAQVQQAIRNIYALGVFSDVKLLAERTGPNRMNIIIEVTEYPVLNRLTITGEDKIDKDDLEDKVRILSGHIVSPSAVTRAVDEIIKEYREKGYYLAKVEPMQHEVGSGLIDLELVIDEGDRVQVEHIAFHDNDIVPSGKLRDQMKTKEDRWWRSADFDEEQYREDKESILSFYRKHGYREARILKDSVYVGESQKNLYIDLWMDEGNQYTYGAISWGGNELLSDAQVHRTLLLSEGDVYNREAFDEAVFRLASAYQEQGYWSVGIDPVETPHNDTIDVAFSVIEGEPSEVRFVDITGNDKTKDKVIRREMALVPGETFRRSDLERSHRNIFYLNYFENVEPDIQPLPNNNVDVLMSVSEKPTGTVNMAVGYGEVDKWVGSIGLSIPNLMGNGQQLDFQWEFGQTRTSFYLSFTEPWVFDTPTSGSVTLFNIKRNLTVTEESRGFSVRLGRRLRWPDDYSRVYTSYSFSSEEYMFPNSWSDDDKRLYVSDPNDPQIISSRVGVGYVRDSRNLPLFPTGGTYLSYDLQMAGGPWGGDVSYRKHTTQANFYLPIIDIMGWIPGLALKTTFGQINTSELTNVPLSERFRPGGISFDGQIRGYPDYSIGPRGDFGATGGFTMLITTVEASFPFVDQQIYGVAFADAGNAWRDIDEMNLTDLRRSIGFGVRFIMPLAGVIGLDFSYGYDRTGLQGGRGWETHFQFGPTVFR